MINFTGRDYAGPHSSNRLFEWIMAIMMLLIAMTMAVPGDTLGRGSLYMIQLLFGLGETVAAVVLAGAGVLRCFALYANGNIPIYGPKARITGSAIGALSWSILLVALLYDSIITGAASIMVPVFGSLIIGEIVSAYRATRDGRHKSKLR